MCLPFLPFLILWFASGRAQLCSFSREFAVDNCTACPTLDHTRGDVRMAVCQERAAGTGVGIAYACVCLDFPDAEALVEVRQDGSKGRRWTYAELLVDTERLAMALSTRFDTGERIVVWSPNSPEWVLMEYACALSGLVLVTANPAFQARELAYVLKQSGAVALFLVEKFRGNPMGQIGAEVAKGIEGIREITDMNTDAFYAKGPCRPSLPTVQPSNAAMIQYTSGTTGFPKGAVLSHRGLVNNARFYASRCGATKATTWVNIMPMFHTSGCGMVTLGCL